MKNFQIKKEEGSNNFNTRTGVVRDARATVESDTDPQQVKPEESQDTVKKNL